MKSDRDTVFSTTSRTTLTCSDDSQEVLPKADYLSGNGPHRVVAIRFSLGNCDCSSMWGEIKWWRSFSETRMGRIESLELDEVVDSINVQRCFIENRFRVEREGSA